MSDFNLTYVQTGDLGNKIGGQEGAKGILSGELIVVPRNDPRAAAVVLQFERKVSVASRRFVTGESFTKSNPKVKFGYVASRRFVTNKSFTKSNPKVKFGYIDERIVKLFGKSQDVPAAEIAVNTLLVPKHDPEIMVALGPQSRRFIKLGQFYQLIEAQGQGQEGPLLVNGCANIAYVLDENVAAWAVSAGWGRSYGDWCVNVYSVACLSEWGAGDQVLSQVA